MNGASSFHPGGVNVGFVDGSVRFIKESISSWQFDPTHGFPMGVTRRRFDLGTGTGHPGRRLADARLVQWRRSHQFRSVLIDDDWSERERVAPGGKVGWNVPNDPRRQSSGRFFFPERTSRPGGDNGGAQRVLDGHRHPGGSAVSLGLDQALFRRDHGHERSSSIQAWLEEGRIKGLQEGLAEEARRIILRLGQIRLGTPGETVKTQLDAIPQLDKLERLTERLLIVSSWDELLGHE